MLLAFRYFYIFRFIKGKESFMFSFYFKMKINKVLEFNVIRFPCSEASAALS